MRIAYFDCFSGISGDMILGALMDAGLDKQLLEERLKSLNLDGYHLELSKVTKQGIAGTKVNVLIEESYVHRHLEDIYTILENSSLSHKIKGMAKKIFLNLAKAEAKIHNTDVAKIHFHEVGALDAIIDIVGSVIGLEELGVEEIYASPLHVGSGFVKCAHGVMPIPAPATTELVKGIPIYSKGVEGELVTPTGAAIITTLAKGFGKMPDLTIENTGYGAGERDLEIPNLLRIIIGSNKTAVAHTHSGVMTMIETNIDDMNPEFFDFLLYRLSMEGAAEVYLSSVYMKKNRPGTVLHVLAPKDKEMRLVETIFKETTTLGVRCHEVQKHDLQIEHHKVDTKFGTIGITIGKRGDEVLSALPKYEDCRMIALKYNIPVKIIYDEAKTLSSKYGRL